MAALIKVRDPLLAQGERMGSGGKSGGNGGQEPYEYPNTLQSKSIAKVLDVVSEGPIRGLVNGLRSVYLNDTPFQNADRTYNFGGATIKWRLGLPDQDVIEGFEATTTPFGVGVEVQHLGDSYSGALVRRINNDNANAVRVLLTLSGLTQAVADTGELTGYKVEISIEVRSNANNPGSAWVQKVAEPIRGKTTSQFQQQYRIPLDGTGPWDVRVRRVSPDDDSANVQSRFFWTSYTEIVDHRYIYPDTALFGCQFDAEFFGNSFPSRGYEIYGRIINVPSNYDPIERTYEGIWDGTFKLAYCNNPAWVLWDLLTNTRFGIGEVLPDARVSKWDLYNIGRYNDRLVSDGTGVGFDPDVVEVRKERVTLVSDVNIDVNDAPEYIDGWKMDAGVRVGLIGQTDKAENGIWVYNGQDLAMTRATDMDAAGDVLGATFAVYGGTYADKFFRCCHAITTMGSDDIEFAGVEPMFTFNTVVNQRMSAYNAITAICGMMRTSAVWAAGQMTFIQDAPKPATKVFSPANVIEGVFNYSGTALRARHTACTVTWTNPDLGYIADDLLVEHKEGILRYGYNVLSITAYGCTSKAQALRLARFALHTEYLETDTVQFRIGMGEADILPGSIVDIYDPMMTQAEWAGRLREVSTSEVKFDRPLSFDGARTYYLTTITAGNQMVERELVNPGTGDYITATLVTPLDGDDMPIVNAMFGVSSDVLEPRSFRIMSIADDEEKGQYKVLGTQHAPEKFALIENKIPEVTRAFSDLPGTEVVEPVATMSLRYYTARTQGTTSQGFLYVDWEASPDPYLDGYIVSVQYGEDNIIVLPMQKMTEVTLPNPKMEYVTVWVRAVSLKGYKSRPKLRRIDLTAGTASGKTLITDVEIQGGGLEWSGRNVFLQWLAKPIYAPDGTLPTDGVDPYFKEFRVRLRDTDTLSILKTYTTHTPRLTIPIDDLLLVSAGVREYKISVALIDKNDVASTETTVTIANPPPPAYEPSEVDVTAYGVTFTFDEIVDPDYRGVIVYAGTSPGVLTDLSHQWAIGRENVTLALDPGTTYYYRFRHYDEFGYGDPTDEETLTTPSVAVADMETTPPAVPATPTVTSSIASNVDGALVVKMVVDWTANVDADLAGYDVIYFEHGDSTGLGHVNITSTNHDEFLAKPGKLYYIQLRAFDRVNNRSALCTAVTHTTAADTTAPSTPTSLSATAGFSQVTLTWTNPVAADFHVVEVYENSTNTSVGATLVTTVGGAPSANMSFVRGNLTNGVARYFFFKSVDKSGNKSAFSASVTATPLVIQTNEVDTTPPGVPADLALSSVLTVDTDGTQRVKLSATWTANVETDLKGYEIELTEGSDVTIFNAATNRYEWQVKGNVGFTARVRSYDTFNNKSAWSSATGTHTSAKDTTAPSAPSSFAVTASLQNLALAWVNPAATDLAFVEVYEHTSNSSGSASLVATITAKPLAGGSWTRSGLATGQLRYYWLKAVDTSGNASAFTSVASGTTVGVVGGDLDTTAPAVPTGLGLSSALTLDTDGTQVVKMTASFTGVADSDLDHYEIAVSENGGAYVVRAIGTAVSDIFPVKGNVSYAVKVLAVDKLGNRSAYTTPVTQTSTADTTAPSAPTSPAAAAGFQAVSLSWVNPTAADLDHVDIYENTANDSGTATKIASVQATSAAGQTYSRTGRANSTLYYYWFKAVDFSGNASAFTTVVSATTTTVSTSDIDTTPPAVPSGLALSSSVTLDTDGKQRVVLVAAWTANVESDLAGYNVELTEGGSTITQLTTSTNRAEWLVKGNVGFTARIRAYDSLGNKSAWSSATGSHTSAKDTTAPSAPTAGAATGMIGQIMLTWTCPADADVAQIEIWEHTSNSSGSATKIATVQGAASAPGAYARGGLGNAVQRYYWFKAVDTSGNVSAFSGSINATTSLLQTEQVATKAIHSVGASYNTSTITQVNSGAFANLLMSLVVVCTGDLLEVEAYILDEIIGNDNFGYYLTIDNTITASGGNPVGSVYDSIVVRAPGSGVVKMPKVFKWLVTGLSAGSHTFRVYLINTSGNTVTITNRLLSISEIKRAT